MQKQLCGTHQQLCNIKGHIFYGIGNSKVQIMTKAGEPQPLETSSCINNVGAIVRVKQICLLLDKFQASSVASIASAMFSPV